ncbi:unnamed protein product [Peronospora belbahrii]|uniref:Reverse transcriptase Ty1/copia-type domain-containing protein n=1 Tax=Peronospora belbahrii TaxID=622444 RepID=A0AAU9KVW7_9STRA|nr:unnamed protein product [Peronospora belbahrii]
MYFGMMVTLNGDGGYNLDQEEAIGDPLRTKGLMGANSVRALIGDDGYEENLDGVAMLGASNKRSGPTIREFQSLVGSLLWVARCTKPDIAFAVHKATRHTPDARHTRRACMIGCLQRESFGM